MAELIKADLRSGSARYVSSKNPWDVLVGDDTARPVVEAISSSDNTALKRLLSQPELVRTMLETPHIVYEVHLPRQGSGDSREVSAKPISNLDRAMLVAAESGETTIMSTLLDYVAKQDLQLDPWAKWKMIMKIIRQGNASMMEILVHAEPDVITFRLFHNVHPLYEAVRFGKLEVAAVLLRLGADPLHPVEKYTKLRSFRSSLLSHAALHQDPRMMEMLLEHNVPIAGSGALHTAAACYHLDNMRILIARGANIDEALSDWKGWTPMHFAAWKGKDDAMLFLKGKGARSDVKNAEGKTPAQVEKLQSVPLAV